MEWYEGGYGGGCGGNSSNDSVEIANTHDITEEDIQKGAPVEFCKNEAELLSSKTVSRIINLVERKNWEQAPVRPESYVCENIYNRVMSLFPISKNEIEYLISFFENEKTESTAQEIVSKLNIQHGPENKVFIRHYLENLTGGNDVSKALKSILYTLKNYPFVVDFDFEKLAYFKNTKIEGQKYFIYFQNGKVGLIVTVDNKVFCLDADFENLTQINDYGLFFGSIKGEKIEGMYKNKEKHKHTGVFYQFNGTGLEEVYREEGIKQLVKVSPSPTGFLISLSDNEEQGVLKVSEIGEDKEKADENGKKEFKIEKILEAKFNQVRIENEFIFAFINSGNVDLKALEIYNLKGEKLPVEIEYKLGKGIDIEFFNKGENLALTGKDGQKIYRVNKNNERSNLISIIGLQGLEDYYNLDYMTKILNEKIPVCLRYKNGKRVVGVIKFDQPISELSELFKLKDNTNFISDFDEKTGILKIGEYNKIPKYVCFFNKNNGDLFLPKAGYKFDGTCLKKGLFGNKINIDSFESKSDYLAPEYKSSFKFDYKSFDDIKDHFDRVNPSELPISL